MTKLQRHDRADTRATVVVLAVPTHSAVRETDRMHEVRIASVLRAGLRPLREVGTACYKCVIQRTLGVLSQHNHILDTRRLRFITSAAVHKLQ